ncbi:hypothetical protein PoB_003445300 [Plakobranchus ocellatus]|uniref:Secreted protein n=1 Tax=Plakobranchus ocellatus TaxID=259542 RepID=A0AAV4AMZ3_9GAST|nr:hypothetical protein PoB_003445300 [Plakobranchus ocellatus]
MALRKNFCMIFAAVLIATRSPHQMISFAGISGHPRGRSPATSRHLDKTCCTVSSHSTQKQRAVVADQPCRARSARKSVCFALARKICIASLLGRPCKKSPALYAS